MKHLDLNNIEMNAPINFKKLAKYINKYKSNWIGFHLKPLIDRIMTFEKQDHIIFQKYFMAGNKIKDIQKQMNLSYYKISKSLKSSVILISIDNEVIKEQK